MTSRMKLAMTALTAALVLAATVGTASAQRLVIHNQAVRIVWSFLHFSGGFGLSIECPVTLEGSFHSRTISKVPGQLIGVVTQAAVGAFASCRNRESVTAVLVLTVSLPWHIKYSSFSGRLPNITEIHVELVGAAFLLTAFGVSCLFKSTTTSPASAQVRRETGGIITDVAPEVNAAIPLFEGGGLCPASGVFSDGTGVAASVTLQGSSTKISVSLVQ